MGKEDPFNDKKNWGPGPWQDEPDRLEWEHEGLPCLMVRNMAVTGSWCGYVGIGPDHALYGKEYGDLDPEPDVHGGLTYSDFCQGYVCHTPQPGQPDKIWWLGFDCSHFMDLAPRMQAFEVAFMRGCTFPHAPSGNVYRDASYVKKEVENLAAQLVGWDKK